MTVDLTFRPYELTPLCFAQQTTKTNQTVRREVFWRFEKLCHPTIRHCKKTYSTMAKILFIGDSTLTCSKSQLAPFKLPCRLTRCSVVSGFSHALASRAPSESHIVITTLSSFASTSLLNCDTDEGTSEAMKTMMDSFFDTLFGFMSGDQNIRVYLCEPTPR